ncbi:MAG: hypothetical protein HY696_09265 [Deltaproteobacteria bacterium]|nr:hypothetical protein [Deltaproteobacteria bacterium]
MYHFDEPTQETGSFIQDYSGYEHHGSLGNNAALGDGAPLGQGLHLPNDVNGPRDYVIAQSIANFPTDAFTISYWIKGTIDSQAVLNTAFSYNAPGKENVLYITHTSSNTRLAIFDNGWGGFPFAVKEDEWQHFAVTWQLTNKTIRMYRNGIAIGSAFNPAGVPLPQNGTMVLGQEQDGLGTGFDKNQDFSGHFDELAIFDRELSELQIKQLYDRSLANLQLGVRICETANCDDQDFQGPYHQTGAFTDIAHPLRADIDTLPHFQLQGFPQGRYLQYRVHFDAVPPFIPGLKRVAIVASGAAPGSWTMLQNKSGQPFVGLSGFQEIKPVGNHRYQISPNGKDWYFYTGSAWQLSTLEVPIADAVAETMVAQTNTAQEVHLAISQFVAQHHAGSFFFRAFLQTADDGAFGSLEGIALAFTPPPADQPVAAFAAPAFTVAEDAKTANLAVTISQATNESVILEIIRSTSTASHTLDYEPPASQAVIPAGKLSAVIPVTIIDDILAESDETITFMLTNVTNGGLGNTMFTTLTIQDNDTHAEDGNLATELANAKAALETLKADSSATTTALEEKIAALEAAQAAASTKVETSSTTALEEKIAVLEAAQAAAAAETTTTAKVEAPSEDDTAQNTEEATPPTIIQVPAQPAAPASGGCSLWMRGESR